MLDISFIPVDVNDRRLVNGVITLTGIPILVPAFLLMVDLSFIIGLAISVSKKFLSLLLIFVSIFKIYLFNSGEANIIKLSSFYILLN